VQPQLRCPAARDICFGVEPELIEVEQEGWAEVG